MSAPSFRRGGDAAEEANKFTSFNREKFFSLADGDSCYVRFVTDENEWITVDQYAFLPTKPAPADFSGTWPKSMPAVSRSDPAFANVYSNDYVAEFMRDEKGVPYKTTARSWAYACMREQVIENGRVSGYRDKTREVSFERDGKTVTETIKDIVIINMGWKNFFSPLKGFARAYGTVVDRDYWIERRGSGVSTTYSIVPMDAIPGYDLRDPEVAKLYPIGQPLEDLVISRSNDEYYARFFDHRVSAPAQNNSNGAAPQAAPAPTQAGPPQALPQQPTNDIDQSRLRALQDRVMGYAPPAAPQGA